MQEPSCVFCRICSGSLQANMIAQNNAAIAILDAFPLAKGHVLVVTKSHRSKVQHLEKQEVSDLFQLVSRVTGAVEAAMGVEATTIAIHNGRDAGQEIPHVHVHIIPRSAGDGAGPVHSMFRIRPKRSTPEEAASVCSLISSELPAN
ncbi:MAG TPA: HIT family protein [Nitrososphaera sp.]|nr:HIT family protein [Nitrososphaera sp.]